MCPLPISSRVILRQFRRALSGQGEVCPELPIWQVAGWAVGVNSLNAQRHLSGRLGSAAGSGSQWVGGAIGEFPREG
jgi:hypothetical protein